MLVVPLDVAGLLEPASQVFAFDLFDQSEPSVGGFEFAFGLQAGFVERLTTLEKKPHAVFEFAVADDGIYMEKPNRMSVPDFAFGFWKNLVDDARKFVADQSLNIGLLFIVSSNLVVRADSPLARTDD